MTDAKAAVDRAYQLIEAGRPAEALPLTTPLAESLGAGHGALAVHASALKALGRRTEALGFERRAARGNPNSAVAWHNIAGTLDDLGEYGEAKIAIDRALALGLDGPETWLVKAHVHLHLQEGPGAIGAYRQVLRRRPADEAASQELARLLWIETGDWRQAIQPVTTARAAGSRSTPVLLTEAKILEAAGLRDQLHTLLDGAVAQEPDNAAISRAAAHAWLEDDELAKASDLIERTVRLAPRAPQALIEMAAVRLAQGRGEDAFAAARLATEVEPLDQSTWGWLATSARATGDAAYATLYNYDRFVRPYRIEAPVGWPNLEAYLVDLERTLRALHRFKVHPADQSLREGTQTNADFSQSDDPVIKAFFQAIDAPIRRYMAEVGVGDDPLSARNTGAYKIESSWSVLLKPNGFHVNHYHPMGWLSSAFYVRLPKDALDSDAREGWIKFGEPPFKTVPAQPPAHFVRPEPGLLVLFPSYMWHGTVPFTTAEDRLTIAFDVLPA
ncbi:MAG TPA: putative 2OG-Fe(II) oxygenase [Caulobacteraceae bacterium]|nr:putative 2OG-Fe(II) oxygenase [Caulobacteraceae bacterium]